jgi:hypothetical protein
MAARRRPDRRPAVARPPATGDGLTPARTRALFVAILIVAGIAVFANSLHGPFLFDDIASIPENQTIRSLSPVSLFTPSLPAASRSRAGRSPTSRSP